MATMGFTRTFTSRLLACSPFQKNIAIASHIAASSAAAKIDTFNQPGSSAD